MRRIKFKSITILSVAFMLLLALGCDKKETPNMGKVNITFANKPAGLKVYIFAAENTNNPVFSKTMTDINSVSAPLKFGSYVVKPVADSVTVSTVAFQLTKDKKTVDIVYDGVTGHIK